MINQSLVSTVIVSTVILTNLLHDALVAQLKDIINCSTKFTLVRAAISPTEANVHSIHAGSVALALALSVPFFEHTS